MTKPLKMGLDSLNKEFARGGESFFGLKLIPIQKGCKNENGSVASSENVYRKNSKNWDTWNNYHNCPTIGTVGFYSAVLCSKDAGRITNREDPDQTAPWGAVWSGSALFAQTYLSQYLKLLR